MRAARLPTVRVSVATTRCQYQWGGGRSSSEQVSRCDVKWGDMGNRSHGRVPPPLWTSDLGTYLLLLGTPPLPLTSDLGTYPLAMDIKPADLTPPLDIRPRDLPPPLDLRPGDLPSSPGHQTWGPTPFPWTSDLGTYPLHLDIRPGDLSPSSGHQT